MSGPDNAHYRLEATARARPRGAAAPARSVAVGGAEPPSSNTGVHLTVHWLRGTFDMPLEDVLELVSELSEGGYAQSHDWGRYFYRRHHEFVGGLRVYFDPSQENMPPVMVDAPGAACEFLGLGRLRVMFCNARLSRVDLAFDHAPFTPAQMAEWVRSGNVRCKSSSRHYTEDLGAEPDGNTLRLGSRASERMLRAYDGRGFTRLELQLGGERARAFLPVLLADSYDELASTSVGLLRDFVDFVDASRDSNVSRAPLLPLWEAFTEGLERVRVVVAGNAAPTVERLVGYIEYQVAACLATYHRLGYSVGELLEKGRRRMKSRHRSMLAFAGVGG